MLFLAANANVNPLKQIKVLTNWENVDDVFIAFVFLSFFFFFLVYFSMISVDRSLMIVRFVRYL